MYLTSTSISFCGPVVTVLYRIRRSRAGNYRVSTTVCTLYRVTRSLKLYSFRHWISGGTFLFTSHYDLRVGQTIVMLANSLTHFLKGSGTWSDERDKFVSTIILSVYLLCFPPLSKINILMTLGLTCVCTYIRENLSDNNSHNKCQFVQYIQYWLTVFLCIRYNFVTLWIWSVAKHRHLQNCVIDL